MPDRRACSRSRSSRRTRSPTSSPAAPRCRPPLVALLASARRSRRMPNTRGARRLRTAPASTALPSDDADSTASRIHRPSAAPIAEAVALRWRSRTSSSASTTDRRSSPASRCACGRGRVMGLVGESGCGKSVTSYAMLGLLSPGLSVRSGRIRWNGVDLAQADEKTLAAGARPRDRVHLAGADPRARPDVHGRLAARRDPSSGCAESAAARRSASPLQLLDRRRDHRRAARAQELPAPDLGRHGAARRDRPRAVGHAEAADRRRADDRARRHDPGRDPRAAARADRRARHVDHPRHARPRRRRRPLRRRVGHVRRADRRDRLGARRARASRAPVHDGAAGRRPARDHRLRRHDAARVHPRPGAPARVVDERMPLRRRLPVRPGRVHDRDPAAASRARATAACAASAATRCAAGRRSGDARRDRRRA